MPQFLSVDAQASVNNVRTAAPIFLNGYADLTKRNHMLLRMMGDLGNIEYNANSIAQIWKIMVRQPDVRTFANTTRKTFGDHDPFEELQVGHRGYEASDSLKELDFKRNQGEGQLINLLETKLQQIGTTLGERIAEGLYRDGDTPEFKDGYQGFESALGCMNANRGGTDPGATDRLVLPSDSYGGHKTDLGYFGGTWSSEIPAAQRMNKTQGLNNDWAYGQGSSEYDAMSPTLWNYTSTEWGSGSGEWADNVEEVIRESTNVLHNRTNVGPDIRCCFLIAPDLYPGVENHYADRFRIMQPFSGGDQGFAEYQTIQIDGNAVKSDYGCPPGIGYGFVANHMEMFNFATMNGGGEEPMIDMFGPTWEEAFGAFLMRADTHGNLRLQPKFMCKLAPLSHYVAQSA